MTANGQKKVGNEIMQVFIMLKLQSGNLFRNVDVFSTCCRSYSAILVAHREYHQMQEGELINTITKEMGAKG